jgi:organic radical activating enzyme
MLALTPNKDWIQNNCNDVHLVITGGEPLLGWQRAYGELLLHPRMRTLRNLTFETNGTQRLTDDFKDNLDRWYGNTEDSDPFTLPRREVTFSVSAKLGASGEKWEDAIIPSVVAEYQQWGHAYLKFVVETDAHIEEAIRATDEYRRAGFDGAIYLMPQGGVVEPYDRNKLRIANLCLEKGWYYSPRLHVDLWGNGWGK